MDGGTKGSFWQFPHTLAPFALLNIFLNLRDHPEPVELLLDPLQRVLHPRRPSRAWVRYRVYFWRVEQPRYHRAPCAVGNNNTGGPFYFKVAGAGWNPSCLNLLHLVQCIRWLSSFSSPAGICGTLLSTRTCVPRAPASHG